MRTGVMIYFSKGEMVLSRGKEFIHRDDPL